MLQVRLHELLLHGNRVSSENWPVIINTSGKKETKKERKKETKKERKQEKTKQHQQQQKIDSKA